MAREMTTKAQEAVLEKLKNGTRSEEILQAQENVRAAAASLGLDPEEVERMLA